MGKPDRAREGAGGGAGEYVHILCVQMLRPGVEGRRHLGRATVEGKGLGW
jgi:hypothetical protein